MSTIIHLQENAVEQKESFSLEQIEIIKNVVAKGLTDDEFKMFLYICKRHNLDPIAKQIYAVKRGDQMTIQTGIDGLRLIAERTGKYSPGKNTEFCYDDKGNIISATAYVKKFSGGQWHEVGSTAMLKEYLATSPIWRKMPHVMLEKCAEARALRRAFPGDLSGLLSEEEMEQAKPIEEAKMEVVEETIEKEEIIYLTDLLFEHPEIRDRMFSFCQVSCIEKIRKSQYNVCIKTVLKLLEKKNTQ
jgi:phage recombination protein Bet